MKRRGRKPEYSEEQLLDLAIDVIAEEGLAACTFRSLAERAGTSTTTFTHRFGNRTNLLCKVLNQTYSIGWDQADLGDLEHPDPVKRLYEIGLTDLELTEEIENHKRAYNEILVAAPRVPDLKNTLIELDQSFISASEVLVKRAQEKGMIDPELNPWDLTLALWSMIDGLNLERYAYRDDNRYANHDELDPDQIEFYYRRMFEGLIGRKVEG